MLSILISKCVEYLRASNVLLFLNELLN